MNKIENSKIVLILSVLLMFLVIGAATAADDNLANETVSTSDDVDTLTIDNSGVDEGASAAEATDLVANDANSNSKLNENNGENNVSSTVNKNILGNKNTQEHNDNEDVLRITNDEKLSQYIDNTILKEEVNSGTFTDLNKLIQISTGNNIILNQNFKYNSTTDSLLTSGININKNNIIINGNGYTIDGDKKANLFNINGNNVTIKNLNIKNMGNVFICNANDCLIENINITNITTYGIRLGTGFDNLIIKKVNFKDFKTTYDIIVVYGSNVKVIDCSLVNVTKDGYWGLVTLAVTGSNMALYNTSFINCTLNGDGGSAGRGLIHCQRNKFDGLYNCTFINNKVDSSRTSIDFFFGEYYNVNCVDCVFINNTCDRYSNANTETWYNCTFIGKNIEFNSASAKFSNITLCHFKDANVGVILSQATGSVIQDSDFTNVKNPITISGSNSNFVKNCVINNNVFNNVSSDGGIPIQIKGYANMNIINNCTFNDYSQYIFINTNNPTCLNTDVDKSRISNTTNYTNFTVYDYLYVFENGTVSLKNNSVVSSEGLLWAVNNIFSGGLIDLESNKNYTLNERINIVSNINGNGATINNYSFIVTQPNVILKNIKFNNLSVNLYISSSLVSVRNCSFINTNVLPLACAYSLAGVNIQDVVFENVSNRVILSLNEHGTVDNITFINCTSTEGLITPANSLGNVLRVSNVFVKKSIFSNLISKEHSQQDSYSICNVTISESNLTGIFIYSYKTNKYDTQNYEFPNLVLDNITIRDSNLSGSYLFDAFSSTNSIHLSGNTILSENYKIFKTRYRNLVLTNSSFDDVKAQYLAETTTTLAMLLNNVSLSDSEFVSLSNNYHTSDDFVNLTVSGCNFTDGVILTLKGNSLMDSNFSNFKGHIVSDDRYSVVENTIFEGANNSDLNGSCILINAGYTRVVNCNFTNNVGGNGTIYVSADVDRPTFKDCNFTDNTAENGGALYIVSTPEKRATIGLIGITNKTITYNGLQGFNDLYGWLSDVYSELYLINDTTNISSPDGHSFDSPTNDTLLIYQLVDGGTVYFVRHGDVFQGQGLSYESSFSDVTFKGNGTTVVNMHFILSKDSSNFHISNITFKNNDGGFAMVVNASGVNVNNCSFIGNGGKDITRGGAIQVNADGFTVVNSKFFNNTANHVNTTTRLGDSFGGALYINGSNAFVENCIFGNNSVNGLGAHVYIDDVDNVVLSGNTFANSSSVGSAVVIQGSNINVTGNNFINNTGAEYGGALQIIGELSIATVDGNRFINNSAEDGGALYMAFTNSLGAVNSIKGNIFNNNSALNGGALFVGSTVLNGLVMNNTYSNNSAQCGGAVYVDCAGYVLTGVFTGNNATLGGALYVNQSGVGVIDCTFTNNTALGSESYGSAIYMADRVGLSLNRVVLNGNSVFGGADGLRGDISFGNIAPSVVGALVLGDSPYAQYISNRSSVFYYDVVYVSMIERGAGFTNVSATTMSKALRGINPNGVIYIVDRDFFVSADDYDLFKSIQFSNVAIVGLNNTSIKKADGNTNKYLFILEDGSVVTMNNLTLEGGINVTNGSTLNIEDATITGAKEYGINTNGTVNGQCLKLS